MSNDKAVPDQKALNDAAWKFIDSAPRDSITAVLWNNLKAALWPAIECYIAAAPSQPAAVSAPSDERAVFDAAMREHGFGVRHASYEHCWEMWQACAAARAAAPVSGPTYENTEWRRLAIQYDGHRMQALSHLRMMLQDAEKHAPVVEAFLKAAPVSVQGASIGDDKEYCSLLHKLVVVVANPHVTQEYVAARDALAAYIDSRPRSEDSRAKKVLEAMNHMGGDERGGYCICPLNDGSAPDHKHATICADARRALASTPPKADNE